MGRLSRRRVLQAGCLVGAGALAGCTGGSSLLGGGGGYEEWLYEPGTVGGGDHYSFARLEPRDIDANEDAFDENAFSRLESVEDRYDHVDVDFDEMTSLLLFESSAVITGEYATEDVTEELDDHDFDDETDHEGYTIYLSRDERAAVGVSDEALVSAGGFGDEDAEDVVEAVIDTRIGDEDRYADEEPAFATLTDVLGDGTFLWGRTFEERSRTNEESGIFDHSVASGFRWVLEGETSALDVVVVYDERDDVELDDVKDWVEENDGSRGTFDDVDDVTVEQRDRAAVVSGTVDTDDLSSTFTNF